jgi:hypothetical protein
MRDSDPILRIDLQNKTHQVLKTYTARLPWANRHSLYVHLVTAGGRPARALDLPLFIDDSSPGQTTIRPGETITGELNIAAWCPEVKQAITEGDVMLFWSYQFRPVDGEGAERTGGFLLLPKKRHPEPPP